MARPVHHAVKTHRREPIQPLHNLWQILRLLRGQQIMDMVAHNAQGMERKPMLRPTAINRIEQ